MIATLERAILSVRDFVVWLHDNFPALSTGVALSLATELAEGLNRGLSLKEAILGLTPFISGALIHAQVTPAAKAQERVHKARIEGRSEGRAEKKTTRKTTPKT